MQTDNMELKKLVYLYLMNYAKTQPDLTIMAVNTFQKVSSTFISSFGVLVDCVRLLINSVYCYALFVIKVSLLL